MTGRRDELPNRRLKTSYSVVHNTLRWQVDYGWDHGGKIREIFVAPAWDEANKTKPDSERMRELEVTMILASFSLQTTEDVTSLSRLFASDADEEPLTLFERVLRKAVEVEPRDAEAARLAYACRAAKQEGERDAKPDPGAPAPSGA